MKSLLDNETQNEVLQRMHSLTPETTAKWGNMNVTQMLKHCQGPLEVGIGSKQLNTKVGFMKKLLFKAIKSSMYNDKLWQQGIPTAKEYLVTSTEDFDTEKKQLETFINEFSKLKSKTDWPKHPFFGKFNTEQWGKAQYKHLDHHFRQFGV